MDHVSLLLRPDLGKKPYRLKCRFVFDAAPRNLLRVEIWKRELEKAKFQAAEMFVADMAKQGWEHVPKHGFHLRGPFPATPEPVQLKAPRVLTARELLPMVRAGYRPPEEPDTGVTLVLPLGENDTWEWELQAVFIRNTILTDVPDAHEEF